MPSAFARVLAASVASATAAGGICALQVRAHGVTAAVRTHARTSPGATSASSFITLAHDSADRALTAPPTHEPTPVATPAPIASSAPQPYHAPAAAVAAPVHAGPPPAPKPPPAPVVRYNWLRSDDGSVNTGVGYYTDCSGQAPVPRGYADIDTCMREVTYYFVGHHPGVFNGLVNMPVGAGITYWDGGGNAHHYVIVARRVVRSADGLPSPIGAVEFQTCVDLQGVQDYILDANPG